MERREFDDDVCESRGLIAAVVTSSNNASLPATLTVMNPSGTSPGFPLQ
jgi:hypothetical protein